MVMLSTQAKLSLALIGITVTWRVSGYFLRRFFVRKFTVTEDLKHLGKARQDEQRIRGNAVVCGGSIAGLLAARVCADHFENVIIIDSEEWLASEEGISAVCDDKGNMYPRTGLHRRSRVAQYGSFHGYLVFLTDAMRALFPEFDEEMVKRDVIFQPANLNIYLPFGRLRPSLEEPNGEYLETFCASRETYEKTLRSLVRKQRNIHWTAGTVSGINLDSSDNNRIESVNVRNPDGSNQEIAAALFVDCTGRSQCGFRWLKRMDEQAATSQFHTNSGGKLPLEKARAQYDFQGNARTFEFHVTPSLSARMPIPGGYANAGWILTFFPQPGFENRSVTMAKCEGNRIRFCAIGWASPHLPQTPQEIPDYLRSLHQNPPFEDWIYDVLNVLLEDESCAVVTLKVPPCSYIRYDRAAYVPNNFIATGDAVMCVNPVWGQGCTKAAIGTVVLDSILRRPSVCMSTTLPLGFSTVFFKEHHNKVSSAWDGTKPVDYGFDTTIPAEGETLKSEWFMSMFGHYMLRVAIKDRDFDSLLWRARMFLVPPTDMMHPVILCKMAALVIKDWLSAWTKAKPAAVI